MLTDSYSLLEQPLIIEKAFKSETQKLFKIKMENFYLNSLGRIYKVQELNSKYIRIIEKTYDDAIAFSSYRWDKMIFTNKIPKQVAAPLDWTFALGREFQSHMILSNERLEELKDESRHSVMAGDYKKCFDSIEKAYQGLPKLPSVYLVIMQTFDIVAFENYLSYIYTYSYSNKGWKPDEWVKIAPPELEHMQEAKIGLGLYSHNSFFRNGRFYLKYIGCGKTNDKFCAIFDYYCDYSEVRMQNKGLSDIQRNGTSYYHGQIWIDLDSHDIERGTMFESYIALQEGSTKTPVHIRRKVLCETLIE